jgi:hypothetical protein
MVIRILSVYNDDEWDKILPEKMNISPIHFRFFSFLLTVVYFNQIYNLRRSLIFNIFNFKNNDCTENKNKRDSYIMFSIKTM